MSIYIKGMEMPKQGTIIMILPDGTVQDMFFKTKLGEALPVPPHGDLIDRTELIKHDNQHYEYLSDEFYVTVRDIERASTIIPADKED